MVAASMHPEQRPRPFFKVGLRSLLWSCCCGGNVRYVRKTEYKMGVSDTGPEMDWVDGLEGLCG